MHADPPQCRSRCPCHSSSPMTTFLLEGDRRTRSCSLVLVGVGGGAIPSQSDSLDHQQDGLLRLAECARVHARTAISSLVRVVADAKLGTPTRFASEDGEGCCARLVLHILKLPRDTVSPSAGANARLRRQTRCAVHANHYW